MPVLCLYGADTLPTVLRQYHAAHKVGCLYINIKFRKKEEMRNANL